MTFGHPPPEPLPVRSRVIQRLTYLDELVKSTLDDYFSANDGPEARQACRSRIQQYIAEVEQLLPQFPEAEPPPVQRVLMDLPVHLLDEEAGIQETFVVVGPDEVDATAGRISFLSPLGSALLLKRTEETILVEAPGGSFMYRVVRIG